uniref:Peptidase S8/S53 domain-containing protein n=1 Tax=Geobacter metallireducens TaxID=28232 RepID=A0A831UC67_GEOME
MKGILPSCFSMLLLLLAGMTIPAGADIIEATLRKKLDVLEPHDEIPVIIRLAGKTDFGRIKGREKGARRSEIVRALRETAATSSKHLEEALETRRGSKLRQLWIINSIAATLPSGLIQELATVPGVEAVTLDAVIRLPVTTREGTATPEWNIDAINAPELWELGYTGQGVVVANMDSGVDPNHPDLQGRWRGSANSWFDPYGEHPLPYDRTGHGTQTMGLMVGGNSGGTAIGVAPGATWIAAKIYNDEGEASFSAIHESFQWLLDPDGNPATDDAPDVVNISWGIQDANHGCIKEFEPDVQALKAAGILLSFAAGNDGPAPSTSVSPANYPDSIAVGAVDATRTIILSSSRGPSACGGTYPTFAAPGVNVRTTDIYLGIPGAYATVSGTSFASPHVAGAMALLRNAFPDMTVPEMEFFLKKTAIDLGPPGVDDSYGFGLPDVAGAYSAFLQSPKGNVLINGGAATTNTRTVTLTLSAADQQDTVTNMRFSWDNVTWYAWEPFASTRNATIQGGNGINTIHVQFRDASGNVSAVYTDSIFYDKTAPTGSVVINGGAVATRVRPVTLAVNAADADGMVTGMRFSWDNVTWYGWEAYTSTRSAFIQGGDGTKTIFVQFRDNSGNVSPVYSDSILFDTTAPTGSVVINDDAATTGIRPVTLSLRASDTTTAVAAMRFSWDSIVWYGWEPFAASRNATLPGAAPGAYTIRVQFRDVAGNLSPIYADPITYAP